jgi:hypothetical protein
MELVGPEIALASSRIRDVVAEARRGAGLRAGRGGRLRGATMMARATRVVRPCMPERRHSASSASITRCTWSRCTEKATMRNASRFANASARFTSANTISSRRNATSRDARNVTCFGDAGTTGGRVT